MKRFFTSVALALALLPPLGCSARKFTQIRYNPWPENKAVETPPHYHLLLTVSEESLKSGYPLSNPDLLAAAISETLEKENRGKMTSYQILEKEEDLQPWTTGFIILTPVLKVRAKFGVSVTNANWTATLEARSKYQPGLYDLSQDELRTTVQTYKTLDVSDHNDNPSIRKWVESVEAKLYEDFAKKLAAKISFEQKETALPYYAGKSDAMEQAAAAAETGDWAKAVSLWEEEVKRDPENDKAYANLSAAYESQRNWDKALEYHKLSIEHQSKGFRGLSAVYVKEREETLRGMIALSQSSSAAAKQLAPGTTLAILPLENETNDLTAPTRIREALAERAKTLGLTVMLLEEVDDKLRRNGYTDAGQFKAAGSAKELGKIVGADFLILGNAEEFRIMPEKQVKARLRLVYAPDAAVIHERTLEILEEPSNVLNAILQQVIQRSANLGKDKMKGKILSEETEALAARYLRPWPHFKN